jgi:probable addiction module antidote protein
MRKYRTFDQVEEEYYREHPEEIDSFLIVTFEEYAKNNDTGALLSALRMISRVKGVTATAEAAGISRKGLQKALSEQGNPLFENVNAILHAMGYQPIRLVLRDIVGNIHNLSVYTVILSMPCPYDLLHLCLTELYWAISLFHKLW